MKKIVLLLIFILATNILLLAEDAYYTVEYTNEFPSEDEILLSQIYDIIPNVSTCTPGVLKQSEIQKILDLVNRIRSHHNLYPVTYNSTVDNESMDACLNMVASGELSHDPNPSTPCFTVAAGRGRQFSNLHMNYSSAPINVASESSIIGWMIDDKSANALDKVGHRRAIINPFLKSFSFGRADGQQVGSNNYIIAMNFHYQNFVTGGIQGQDIEYVAYPYNNYPPAWVNKDFYLSFNVVYSKSGAFSNQNVDFSNTIITVKNENNNNMQVHSKTHDNQGWGSFPNNLCWKVNGLQNEVRYEVTIENVNVNGQMRNYSYWFKLTDKDETNPPVTPTLVTPVNMAENQNLQVNLYWELTQNTSRYKVQLSKDDGFNSLLVNEDQLINNGFITPQLEYETTYYWRVASVNAAGSSPWTDTWSFTTTKPAPGTASLLEPENNAENIILTPEMKWNAVEGATKYHLQIADADDFDGWSVIVSRVNLEETNFIVPTSQLSTLTTYYWRIRAENLGGTGPWSEVWTFKTLDPNDVIVELLQPENNSIDLPLDPILQWSPIAGASIYHLQVAYEDDFNDWSFAVNSDNVQNESYHIDKNELLPFTKYYWRVKPLYLGFNAQWSAVYNFTTSDFTSVNDLLEDAVLNIYPNPANSMLYIDLNTISNSKFKLEIINILGLKVMEIDLMELHAGTNKIELNVNSLPIGLYAVKISDGSKEYRRTFYIVK